MNSSISQADPNGAQDIPEICLLSPVSFGNPASNHLDEAVTEIIDNIPKTIRTKFYSDLNIYEKNGQLRAYYIIIPSPCTHQESTQKVLMVENAARTHEYSSLLSTRRSYSRSILSV